MQRVFLFALTFPLLASTVLSASLAACSPTASGATPTGIPIPVTSTPIPLPESIAPMVATAAGQAAQVSPWSPPTLEQALVASRVGALPAEIARYRLDFAIPYGLAREGIKNTRVIFFPDNGLAGSNYRFAPLIVNPEGLVIWAYDPVMGQLEWPVKLDLLVDAAGKPYYRLHTEGLSYQTIPDSQGATIIWGGTVDGVPGKHLAILAKDPVTLPDGRQVYASYWNKFTQEWLPTSGLAEAILSPPYVLSFEGRVTEGATTVIVPFEIGLMKNMIERQDEPVKRILLNPDRPDGPDIMAEYLVKLCWFKYNHDNNENVSFGEYVKLLSQGKGDVDILVADPKIGGWDSVQKLKFYRAKYSPLQGIRWIYSDWLFSNHLKAKYFKYVTIPEGSSKLTVVANNLSTPDHFKIDNSKDVANFALTAQLVVDLTTIFINAKPEWVENNGYVGVQPGNNAAYQEIPEIEKEYRDTIRKINLGDIEVIAPQDTFFIIEQ